jgi:hypothetical protein
MLLLSRVQRVVLGVAVALFISQQGCASKSVRPHPLAQSGLSGERVVVVIKRAPEGEGLKTPEKGVFAEMGRGAAPGVQAMMQSALSCFYTGPIICVPSFLVAGALTAVGVIYGGVASQPAATWDKAEGIFRAHLKEQNFDHLLEERLIAFAQESGFAFQSINGPETNTGKPIDYEKLSRKGIGLVLELSEITIQLQAANSEVNPPRRFFTSVRAKVYRTNDGTLLDDSIVADDKGEIHPLDDWLLNNGISFREQVSFAAKRTAEMIVMDLLLLPSLSERPVQIGPLPLVASNLIMSITMYGIKPIYPPVEFLKSMITPTWVSSLQPTLQWEPYQGNNVTYDLIIWRGGYHTELIYSREGLSEAFHVLETPLPSASVYRWTVRARYTSGGLTRITEWAMWSPKLGPYVKVMTLGLAYLLPENRSYYLFRTK